MTPLPYALPLRIRKAAESYVVEDASGVALAYSISMRIGAGKGSSIGSPAPTPRYDVYQQGPHQQRHPLHRRTNPGPHP
jgi:hypothetical protein